MFLWISLQKLSLVPVSTLTDSQALMHLPAQTVRGLGLSQFEIIKQMGALSYQTFGSLYANFPQVCISADFELPIVQRVGMLYPNITNNNNNNKRLSIGIKNIYHIRLTLFVCNTLTSIFSNYACVKSRARTAFSSF